MVLAMSDVIDLLVAAVGADNVRSGEHVKDDESHDEALTATPVRPVAVVTPTSAAEVSATRWSRALSRTRPTGPSGGR